jgi:hypothetical protein
MSRFFQNEQRRDSLHLLRFLLELSLRRDGLVNSTAVCNFDHSRNHCPNQCCPPFFMLISTFYQICLFVSTFCCFSLSTCLFSNSCPDVILCVCLDYLLRDNQRMVLCFSSLSVFVQFLFILPPIHYCYVNYLTLQISFKSKHKHYLQKNYFEFFENSA